MNIAIYGGTFNPVHKGHYNCLKSVLDAVELDKVIVLPDRIPPHKSAEGLISGEDRLEMCRLAFGELDKVEVSEWELKQTGKSYSVITLRHFHKLYPEDMLLSFEKWYRYEEILQLASLICVSRENAVTNQILQQHADEMTQNSGGEIIIVDTKPFEVSSTQIRKMIENSQIPSCYLDENVVQYISVKNLYRH